MYRAIHTAARATRRTIVRHPEKKGAYCNHTQFRNEIEWKIIAHNQNPAPWPLLVFWTTGGGVKSFFPQINSGCSSTNRTAIRRQ